MKRGIQYYVDSHLACIVLDSPQRKNGLTLELLAELQRALDAAIADTAVRALLLTAHGSVFCNGMDFAASAGDDGSNPAAANDDADGDGANDASPAAANGDSVDPAAAQFARLLASIHDAPKPVCAVVAGQARAGGVGLVAAADVVIAAEGARFELSELLFGLLPAVVLPVLADRIGMSNARYLCLSARNITAADALRMGLVDQVVADDGLERATAALCRQLLRIDPRAVPVLKQYTSELAALPRLSERLAHAQPLLARLLRDPDTRAAIAGFVEGFTPPWFAPYRPARARIQERVEQTERVERKGRAS